MRFANDLSSEAALPPAGMAPLTGSRAFRVPRRTPQPAAEPASDPPDEDPNADVSDEAAGLGEDAEGPPAPAEERTAEGEEGDAAVDGDGPGTAGPTDGGRATSRGRGRGGRRAGPAQGVPVNEGRPPPASPGVQE